MNTKNEIGNEAILYLILKLLNKNERLYLYSLIQNNKLQQASDFVDEKLPYLADSICDFVEKNKIS